MAFEGRKIEDLRSVMASPLNPDLKISKAIKIEGWLGLVLSILYLCYAAFNTYLTVIGVIDYQTRRGPDRDIFIYANGIGGTIFSAMYYLPGLIFFIYNIILLRKFQTGDEAAVSKMIKVGSYFLSVFALPISVVVMIGVAGSKKNLVRGYIIFLLVLMTITFLSLNTLPFLPYLSLLGYLGNGFWYRYNTNMYALQLNMMQEK